MTAMWSRWARRKRLLGLAYLTTTALAIAGAVLLWAIGAGLLVLIPGAIGCVSLVLATDAFATANRYAREARR